MKISVDDLYRAAIRLHQQGRTAEAGELDERILGQRPRHAGALHLKGVLALQGGQYDEAVALIERSLKIEPQHALALSNLGVAYRALRRHEEAITVLRKAVAIDPGLTDALANLGETLVRAGEVAESVIYNRRALERDPNRLGLQSSLLFALNYLAENDPIEAAGHARRLGQLIEARAPARTTHANAPDPDRPLRIGLLSADFRSHPVGRFLIGVLPLIDPAMYRLFAYSGVEQDDALTAQLRAAIPDWVDMTELSDSALDERIVGDGIDILVDLSGLTAGNRLAVLSRKPAPVAVTWLGYFATTGLGAIDYVLANRFVIPEAEEKQWLEKVWCMPDTYLCFTEPPDASEAGPLPALASRQLTFGCFNNFNKLSDATLRTWATLLAEMAEARLILRSPGLYSNATLEGLRRRMRGAGIDIGRVRIDPAITDYAAHLRSYGEIDVALDPFPYNGGTTTVEALYMGVPVLVRAGDRYVAHMGESILHNVGLADWIAQDEADYPRLAAAKTRDLNALAELRAGLRARMLASPLFDAPRFARNLEAAWRGMWQAWCAARQSG